MPQPEEVSKRQPVGWYLAWAGASAFAFFGVWHAVEVGVGFDAHAYWAAVQHMDQLYGAPALSRDAYLYSPAFAQAIWPLGRLPWPLFWMLWIALMAVAFAWLLRPLPRQWFIPAFVATLPEILTGNIYALMAVGLVLGATRGPPWVFLGLTKVTAGGIGVVWLTMTRQWRALLWGAATAVAVVATSVAVSPNQWMDWVRFLLHGSQPLANSISSPILTVVLVVVGFGLVVLAALSRRAWLLAVAVIFLSPTIGLNTLTLLAAIPRLAYALEPDAATSRHGRRTDASHRISLALETAS